MSADADALEMLAAELDARKYATCLVTATGRRTHLQVTNRAVTSLTEGVYSDGEYFRWGWAERIAPTSEVAAAAAVVAGLLRALDAG